MIATTIKTNVPASFGSFDGLKRHCVKYASAKGGVKRCAKFQKGYGYPTCAGLKGKNTRSHGLLRKKWCAGSGTTTKAKKARRRSKKR